MGASADAVLVVGAHGFLGRAIVGALHDAGHRTHGLVRREEHRATVEAAGGIPFVGDILDPSSLARALVGCRATVHVAASYGASEDEGTSARVRIEGARNLARAARAAGASRLVLGSGYWVYAGTDGRLTDDSPVDPRGESKINYEAELAALQEAGDGLDVLIVRPGMVYGDGSWLRGLFDSVRAGGYRLPGDGENRWSLIELGDAARAFSAVLDRGRPGAAYLAVDDHPMQVREIAGLIAERLGVPPPVGVPLEQLAQVVGADVAYHLAANRPGSSAQLRGLGWSAQVPDARLGLPELLRRMR